MKMFDDLPDDEKLKLFRRFQVMREKRKALAEEKRKALNRLFESGRRVAITNDGEEFLPKLQFRLACTDLEAEYPRTRLDRSSLGMRYGFLSPGGGKTDKYMVNLLMKDMLDVLQTEGPMTTSSLFSSTSTDLPSARGKMWALYTLLRAGYVGFVE